MPQYVFVRRRGDFGPLTIPPGMPRGPYVIPGSGVGDWGAAITTLIAEKELSDLMRGVRKLNDQLVSAIKSRNETLKGYKEALRLFKEAQAKYGPLMVGITPNFKVLPAATALGTARKGVKVFARQIQLLIAMDRVFAQISVELTKAGLASDADAVNQTLRIIRRFTDETTTLFRPVPEYRDTRMKILGLAENTIMPQMGVGRFEYGNPRWLIAFIKAAEQVVPLPNDPGTPKEIREAGLGNPLPVLVVALIWVIGVISAAVVAAVSISKIIDGLNSKANTARELLLSCQERKKEVELAMRRRGEPSKAILVRMKEIDESCKESVEQIPEAPSLIGPILTPIGVILGIAIGGKVAGVF